MTHGAGESEILRSILIEEAEARAGAHLELDRLADYLADRLDPDAEEQVREHLVGCRRCTATLLDLEPLTRPEAARRPGVADFETETAWRVLRERVRVTDELDRAAAARRWSVALAASLLAATMGMSLWVARLQQSTDELGQQVSELSRPLVNMPVFYVDETTRGGERVWPRMEVPAGTGHFVLIFASADLEPAVDYEVEFVDAQGREVWRGGGLEMSESGGLRLGLPRRLLPEGEYRIRLRAPVGDSRQELVEYRRRIVYLDGP